MVSSHDIFVDLLGDELAGWRMAGHGCFRMVAPGLIESEGGPGLLWYGVRQFADFVLCVDWRVAHAEAKSGVFIRFPALGREDPETDWRRAARDGYVVQIDECDPHPGPHGAGDALHCTGAICGLAPSVRHASHPIGAWNEFRITARGEAITVVLNGIQVAHLDHDLGRPRIGHIGVHNHDSGSHVQFRALRLRLL